MISISLKSAVRWCIASFGAGAVFGPTALPIITAFILEQLRRYTGGVP